MLVTPALLGSACTVGTLQSYETGAESGCTLDEYTVDCYNFSNNGSGDNAFLTASEVEVTPTVVGDSFTLEFSAEPGYEFQASTGYTDIYYIGYYLTDPAVGPIKGPSINTGPGTGDPPTLSGAFCGGGDLAYTGPVGTGCTVLDNPFVALGPIASSSSASASYFFAYFNSDNELILTLDSGDTISSFGSTDTLVETTPEPSTLWLTPGLLAILWLGKKRPASLL